MSQIRECLPHRIPIVILLAYCALSFAGLAVGGCAPFQPAGIPTTSTPVEASPNSIEAGSSPTPSPHTTAVATAVPSPTAGGSDTLAILKSNQVPAGDWREEAIRLKGIPNIPEVVSTAPASYAIGHAASFYVTSMDTRESRELTARLAYETQNAYFFVEEGVQVDVLDVQSLVDEFQDKIYPTNREFFGSEWIPGVDGDPRLYILYARGLGRFTQAYFDSASEFSHLAHPFSNEKEIIVLNADASPLNDDYWRPTLAHEFQHAIHWHQNRNAELWLNEGASMLAETINGYDAGPQTAFLNRPDLQLNDWVDPNASSLEVVGHYNAAFLFLTYLFDRFGGNAIQTLVANRASGITAVEGTLASLGLTDPTTGVALTAEDVFADWVIANFLNDRGLANGQYGYTTFADKIPGPTDTITDCPTGLISAGVHQFGTRYIEIGCRGDLTIHFSGSQHASLVPTQPHGGSYGMWSSRQDESDTTLTRSFDLRGVLSATLSYWAWWEIEKDYDYAYLEVSTNGGETWQIIPTASGSGANPTGGNLGWGYTGCSGGGDPSQDCRASWIHEQVDLSAYAGQTILVRFEYITDAALSYASLMLDDISIPEIEYTCSFEEDTCGWESAGFARVDNVLPQTLVVQLIRRSGGQSTVERMLLDANNQGSLPLSLDSGDTAILLVSGTTPFTTEDAGFELEIK